MKTARSFYDTLMQTLREIFDENAYARMFLKDFVINDHIPSITAEAARPRIARIVIGRGRARMPSRSGERKARKLRPSRLRPA